MQKKVRNGEDAIAKSPRRLRPNSDRGSHSRSYNNG
jgi:hypothetical protein